MKWDPVVFVDCLGLVDQQEREVTQEELDQLGSQDHRLALIIGLASGLHSQTGKYQLAHAFEKKLLKWIYSLELDLFIGIGFELFAIL